MIKDRIVKSELVPWKFFTFLQPDGFKEMSGDSYKKLKASIVNNNFVESFKVWSNNGSLYCLDGYHRCKILHELEIAGHKVPEKFRADFIKCKDKKDASKLVLIYSSIYARMSDEGLYEFLHTQNLDFDKLKLEIDLPDFKMDRFEMGYMRDTSKDEIEDEIPEVKKAKAKLGDLYLLGGRHRLLCGDCTDKGMVDRLMDGKKANLYFTDPPYAVNYGADQNLLNMKSGGKSKLTARPIIGDNLSPKEASEQIWLPAFNLAFEICDEAASFYLTMPQGGDQMMMMMMMMSAKWTIKHELIWVKNAPVFSMGRLDYDYQHEPILFGWKKKHNFYKTGEYQTSVWFINKNLSSELHPTMKPVALMTNALNNSTQANAICYDSFLGSGSTLIACEKTNRICYGMEIEPLYVDVIIERYKNYSGKEVELLGNYATKRTLKKKTANG